MSSWMKRRIERSRARCQKSMLAHKRRATGERSKNESVKRPQTIADARVSSSASTK